MSTITNSGKAHIFLAANRSSVENSMRRSLATQLLDQFCGTGCQLTEHTLAGNSSIMLPTTGNGCSLLLPVVGAAAVTPAGGKQKQIPVGTIVGVKHAEGILQLRNPYPDQLTQILQISVNGANGACAWKEERFDLENNPNQLIKIATLNTTGAASPVHIQVSIGSFAGRMDYQRHVAPGTRFFFQVLEGAFELQNRLLEQGDALLLWNTGQLALEALSEGAVLLCMEAN